MKIAIVHEWLTTFAGSEKALEQILKIFPDADVYCIVDYLPDAKREFLKGHKITTTFIQKLPFVEKNYRSYLPLMPLAISLLDLSDYDLIISSNHAVANGVKTTSKQIHVSYTYSPMRYAWDLREQYLKESNLDRGVKGFLTRFILSRLKKWDYRAAQGVDYFIAISGFIKDRIYRCYGKDSVVIYPPVDTDFYQIGGTKGDFYLVASRMVPYKMMPLIVSAFSDMPDKKLVVIGDGPDFDRVKERAGDNVEILGYQDDLVLREYLQNAKALVFAAEEDFGILPVEAQACGTPVIGFSKGGLLETVNGLDSEKPTGVFFDEQSKLSIKAAVEVFEANSAVFVPENCRENAVRFSEEAFRARFQEYIDSIS
ncbi:MAG: glycosyltransferase family 4 protein [Proteobacteria bacterium]|nr:glycosyltransferase family 4 protein [Pseudomonadota bacterium]